MLRDDSRNNRATELAPDTERLLVLLVYGLLLIVPPFGGITGLIGVVIAHTRLVHVSGSIHESHYRNQILVFWTMLFCALALFTALAFAMGVSALSLFWPFGWHQSWPPWRLMMLGAGWAMLLPLLGLLSVMVLIWYYWRLITGFVRELDDKPY